MATANAEWELLGARVSAINKGKLNKGKLRDALCKETPGASTSTAGSKASSRAAKKKRKVASDPDSDSGDSDDAPLLPTGTHSTLEGAHARFISKMRALVAGGLYIDFAMLAPDRIDKIKMLGTGPKQKQRLSASTVLLTSLSEADVKTHSNDFAAISAGFLNGYIGLVSESPFEDAIERMKDRLGWWHWLTTFFGENHAAAVLFITRFVVKYSAEAFWLPVAETQCTLLVMKALQDSGGSLEPAPRKSVHNNARTNNPKTKPARSSVKSLAAKRGTAYSAAQLTKLAQWRARFPNVCGSRLHKDYICKSERNNTACRFSHVCAWCSSASCKATCAQAESL
jgi:hypothetical protein